jgi:hypothetical protein
MGCSRCDDTGVIRVPVTNLDWIKAPERTAEEIVDFFLQVCTPEAMAAYCDQFESCRDCKVAWLNSKKEG